jgi:hypothetical protein
MTTTISRLYNSYAEAQQAVRGLEAAGVKHNDISIIASNADNWYTGERAADRKASTFPDRDLDGKDDRAEAAGTGAGVGAAIGGAAGLLAGLGLMAIPGVGPVVAAGWLVSTLAGAAAGGATGGVIGALTQAGIGKEDADVYAEGLRRGGAVVSARVADSDAVRLQAIMDRSAVRIADRGAAYRKVGWKSFDPKAAPYTADQVRKEREMYR